jgi:hypothetical protein
VLQGPGEGNRPAAASDAVPAAVVDQLRTSPDARLPRNAKVDETPRPRMETTTFSLPQQMTRWQAAANKPAPALGNGQPVADAARP